MEQYRVTGMSCAACQARVEKAVSALPGVTSCAVSLLTGSMGVEGSATAAEIIRAVEAAGYGASRKDGEPAADALTDRETPLLKRRLLSSLGFLLVLMYFSMGHMLFGWPVPSCFNEHPGALGLLQMVLALIVMVIQRRFFISGFRSVLHGAPNMDTLVALGSSASFLWSLYALIRLLIDGSGAWMEEFYFESAAMILTLISLGKLLEARSKGKTTDALKSLMKLTPPTATVLREGLEQTIPVREIRKGEIFLVRPGESIPTDGAVLEGDSAVDESALTGESIPAEKSPGSRVYAGTVNHSGFLRCEATEVGADTTLSKIISLVSDAAATKAPIAKLADRVSGVFVPAVVGIALVTGVVWLLLGRDFAFALARAISVLVISCPCALGLATPVAIMVGSGVGAKNGILFKTAVSLEETGKVQLVALDKTGTITRGTPEVTAIVPAEGVSEEALLSAAYALEARSEHPLGKAVVREAQRRGIPLTEVTEFRVHPGSGLSALRGENRLRGGSVKFMAGAGALGQTAEALAGEGSTPLLFSENDRLLGLIAAADAVKPDSRMAVAELRGMGLQVVMLTGDHEKTARAIGAQAGIAHIVSGVLPAEKAGVIEKLKALGKVAMVGDGINDAPALTAADMGIAIGAGTDVAIDAADVVLMNSSLSDAAAAIRLSRATLRNIRENLFWAFFYNVIGIPLAAGVYIGLFGWQLHPVFGAAAMSLSSFCVVSNALRLNLFRLRDAGRDRPAGKPVEDAALAAALAEIHSGKEAKTMTKTIKVQGMMCSHCESSVKKALEAIEGVESAVADHVAGTAVVSLTKPVDDAVLSAAVEAKDFRVLGVE